MTPEMRTRMERITFNWFQTLQKDIAGFTESELKNLAEGFVDHVEVVIADQNDVGYDEGQLGKHERRGMK